MECVFEVTGDNHIRVVLEVVTFNTNLLKPCTLCSMGGSRVASDGHTGNIHVKLQQNKARNAENKGHGEVLVTGIGKFLICIIQQNRNENLPPSRNS